jgi:Domain of unknown function (DUF4157)
VASPATQPVTHQTCCTGGTPCNECQKGPPRLQGPRFDTIAVLEAGRVPVSVPGDAAEVEADSLAARALGTLGGSTMGVTPSGGGVQRAATGIGPSHVDGANLSAELGAGRALDGGVRNRMEAAFGTSFANVRIHADESGAQMAHKLRAQAFTFGSHVGFEQGGYRPGTAKGDALLAHELAHTIQQRTRAPSVQRRTAGGCADDVGVDERRDELRRAGRLAHEQIQAHFAAVLDHEIGWPRATKEIRDACPPPTRPQGRLDLWTHRGNWGEIGEIKSVEGVEWGLLDVQHYLQRSEEVVGRLGRGTPCAVERPSDPIDVERDLRWFGGRIRRNGLQPTFRPLRRGVPMEPTRLGPFWGNPRKELSCELTPGGVVTYWCSPRRRRRRQRAAEQVRVLARPEEDRSRDRERPRALQVVRVDPLFRDVTSRLPSRMAPPGRQFVLAIDEAIYLERVRQRQQEEMDRQIRLMQIDPRGVPMIQLTAPLLPLAVVSGVMIVAILAAGVVAGFVLASEAALPAVAAEVLTVGEAAPVAAPPVFSALPTTGVTLRVIQGAATTAPTAGTITVGSITQGTAAAASLLAAITAAGGEAHAQERAAPYLNRPLIAIRDVTGMTVPRTVAVEGTTFRVIAVLSSGDRGAEE